MMSEPIGAGGATILVVDDDALITLNTVDVLSDLGHVALEAYSGREALAILEQRPDVAMLLTDYSMPDMNGVELVSAARRMRPDIKVLLATGYTELPGQQALDVPRLEKPYQQDELGRMVAELLAEPARTL